MSRTALLASVNTVPVIVTLMTMAKAEIITKLYVCSRLRAIWISPRSPVSADAAAWMKNADSREMRARHSVTAAINSVIATMMRTTGRSKRSVLGGRVWPGRWVPIAASIGRATGFVKA